MPTLWTTNNPVEHRKFTTSTNEFISYDDVISIQLKAYYARIVGLKGIMNWHAGGDDYSLGRPELLTAAYNAFSNPGSVTNLIDPSFADKFSILENSS